MLAINTGGGVKMYHPGTAVQRKCLGREPGHGVHDGSGGKWYRVWRGGRGSVTWDGLKGGCVEPLQGHRNPGAGHLYAGGQAR